MHLGLRRFRRVHNRRWATAGFELRVNFGTQSAQFWVWHDVFFGKKKLQCPISWEYAEKLYNMTPAMLRVFASLFFMEMERVAWSHWEHDLIHGTGEGPEPVGFLQIK